MLGETPDEQRRRLALGGDLVPFDDWLAKSFAAVELREVRDDAVKRHAWHLDQNVYDAGCRWCAPKELEG